MHLLDIVAPVVEAVILGQFDTEKVVLAHSSSKLRGTLTSTTSDADEKGVTIRLLDNTTDARHVLDSESEHDEAHGCLAELIELGQTLFDRSLKGCEVTHFIVNAWDSTRNDVVSEHETAEIVISDALALVGDKVSEELIDLNLELILRHLTDRLEEQLAITIIHKTVIEDTVDLYKTDNSSIKNYHNEKVS